MQNDHYTLTVRLWVRHDGKLVGAQMFSDARSMAVAHLVDPDLLQEIVDAVYQVISAKQAAARGQRSTFAVTRL